VQSFGTQPRMRTGERVLFWVSTSQRSIVWSAWRGGAGRPALQKMRDSGIALSFTFFVGIRAADFFRKWPQVSEASEANSGICPIGGHVAI
jgi:hypothetical protein